MLCDFYELTMGNGYYRNGFYKRNVYFDVFFRNVPDGGGFAIAAGLEQIVEYIQQLHFSDDDIAYLRSKGIFDEGFLNYLKNFKFHGDIYAVPEGTPVFPGEPLLTVRAPAIEAQLIETYLLLEINHQSLIATKANRIVRAAQGRAVLEFGSRRAQGADGAVIGARAAYIGGVYKLAAIEDDEGNIIPKIKVSENTAKITNPHFKRLYRLYDRESGKAIADELTLRDEVIDPTKPHVIFDPNATWKTKELTDFTVRELQVPIFQNGELVYELPELNDIKAYCRQQIHTLWDEVKRFENPHTYYVDLSQKLWDVKRGLLEAAKC